MLDGRRTGRPRGDERARCGKDSGVASLFSRRGACILPIMQRGDLPKRGSDMPKCECGCGKDANRGQFIPGHDQRLRTSLEGEVGGLLPLRALVKAAHSYFDGSTSDQTFTQTVRAVFSSTHLPQSTASGPTSCRDEILECAQTVMRESGLDHFTVPEIISCMAKRGSRYAESTIRTHIVSRMCANAPDNHAVTYRDFERTDRGEYQLLR